MRPLPQWRNYNFAPPPANIRYNSLDTYFGSLWAPFTVFGPWGPGIAGAADG